jgi:hypothetical protein
MTSPKFVALKDNKGHISEGVRRPHPYIEGTRSHARRVGDVLEARCSWERRLSLLRKHCVTVA